MDGRHLRHGAGGRREARRAGRADLRSAVAERLRPRDVRRQAGAQARRGADRRASRFVETGLQKLGVPGASLGIVQDGKVLFEDGFGVRELGSAASRTPTRSS